MRIILISILVQILLPLSSSLHTTIDDIECTFDNGGNTDHCNICSNEFSFRVDHNCVDCLDNTLYSFMMISLCLSIVLISIMLILFHAPMAFRTSSIWIWIQIAAIVFYRSSAVFTSTNQQWGFISIFTIFSTSIWRSKCNNNHTWDEGTPFGITIMTCCLFFFIFYIAYNIHFLLRHSPSMYQSQIQRKTEANVMKRYYYIFMNSVSVFEKRWLYLGLNNNVNNDEDIDIDDDEINGTFVYVHPPQHPIAIIDPMSQRPNTNTNDAVHNSPTITPMAVTSQTLATKPTAITAKTTQTLTNSNNKQQQYGEYLAADNYNMNYSKTLTPESNLQLNIDQASSVSKTKRKKSPKKIKSFQLQPTLTLNDQITTTAPTDTNTEHEIFDHDPNEDRMHILSPHDYSFNSYNSENETKNAIDMTMCTCTVHHDQTHKSASFTEEHLPTINEITSNNDYETHTISPKSPERDTVSPSEKLIRIPRLNSNRLESVVENDVTDFKRILKDEKQFDYPKDKNPNDALSDPTYYHMVDVLDHINTTHSQSLSVVHTTQSKYYEAPHVDTVFSQTELTANDEQTTPNTVNDNQFAFPNRINNVETRVETERKETETEMEIETETDRKRMIPNVNIDEKSFQIYLSVHEKLLSHYKQNVNQNNNRSATPDGGHPTTAPQSINTRSNVNLHQSVSNSRTRPDIDNRFSALSDNKDRAKEIGVIMAFNMTFLVCCPLILTESLSVFHCIDIDDGNGNISIRSRSQYVCDHNFWFHFGVFLLSGWILYVLIAIYRAKRRVNQLMKLNLDESMERKYRNAYGDTFSLFWINNVKLNKWFYGFIPILVQLLIVLCSIFINDENESLTWITVLLWFEFVIMCCLRPFLTASDRFCQFILRTFILFEASLMIITIQDPDTGNEDNGDANMEDHPNVEPTNVAICSVIFVTLIISYLAACSGLYPIHPNSTVCSSCFCCCFCCCLDPIQEDETDDDDDDDNDDERLYNDEESHYDQVQMNNNNNKILIENGSNHPLLIGNNGNNNKINNNNNFNPKEAEREREIEIETEHDNKKDMLSPQMDVQQSTNTINNTITPYHRDASSTNKQTPNKFNYPKHINNVFAPPQQTQTIFNYHMHSQTQDHTKTETTSRNAPAFDIDIPPQLHLTNDQTSSNSMNLDRFQSREDRHRFSSIDSGDVLSDNDHDLNLNINNVHASDVRTVFIRNVPSVSVTSNLTQTQSIGSHSQPRLNYNTVKSDSRFINTSVISINDESKTNTNTL